MIDGTEAVAAPAAGAAALLDVLLLPPLGIKAPNAAHPLSMKNEHATSRNLRSLATFHTSEDLPEVEVLGLLPGF
jgi:hypothetical protein